MATVAGSRATNGPDYSRADLKKRIGDRHACAGTSAAGHDLNDLIQNQVIPRLLLAYSAGSARGSASARAAIDPEEAARFAPLPLELAADELLDVVEGYIGRGVPVESVFINLLAPSARRLGQFWEDDSCDFLEVTMGLWRLQEVMREIASRYPAITATNGPGRSALFASMPGDAHVFGTLMVEEVFARGGWQTEVLIEPRRRELLRVVSEQHFDLAGLTISCDCPTATVASLISALRSQAKARDMKVFVGGRMINANPALAAEMGADGTAADASSLLALADKLIKVPGITGSGYLDQPAA